MVSITRNIFFIALTFLMAACTKNEFNLDYDLSREITENYNVTYYATDVRDGVTVQAVASVREGKCLLKCATKKPTLLYITQRTSKIPLVVYAQRGNNIKISGTEREPLTWDVETDKINKALTSWRKENIDVLLKNEADSVNLAVKNFVVENQEDPVSTILMLCYYNRQTNEREYLELMSGLKGDAKKTEWLERAARTDQMFHRYAYPARLYSVVMRSDKKGRDTLILNQRDPSLLFFWHTGYNSKAEIIDSLKVLEKEFPDSILLLADFCLDPDSLGWKNAIRRDTLRSVKRFWVPAAINDPVIMKLKVKTIPYFIVTDKDGDQYYYGSDIKEAMKSYRFLRESADSVNDK